MSGGSLAARAQSAADRGMNDSSGVRSLGGKPGSKGGK